MDPNAANAVAEQVVWYQDPATLQALYRNFCMAVALIAAGRITWLGVRRYKAEPVWQLVAVGGLIAAGAYAAIVGTNGGVLADSFFQLTHRGPAEIGDFVFFMKAGILIALAGAFSVSKKIRT